MKTIQLAGTVSATKSDLKYGYTIGIDGLMKVEEVMEFLSMSRTAVDDRCRLGIYRKTRDRGVVRICRRSVMEHLQIGEVGKTPPKPKRKKEKAVDDSPVEETKKVSQEV